MQSVKSCIQFWESSLFRHEFLMGPATQEFVESTVKHLKALKELEEKIRAGG